MLAVIWSCRLCETTHEAALLGEHYRTRHGLVVHGAGRRRIALPDNVLVALCDGAVRAQAIMAAERDLEGLSPPPPHPGATA